jgi:hypothetical protein
VNMVCNEFLLNCVGNLTDLERIRNAGKPFPSQLKFAFFLINGTLSTADILGKDWSPHSQPFLITLTGCYSFFMKFHLL